LPACCTFGPNGWFYVADERNHRIQYFRESEAAVEPCSLGRVRALFK
jgi:hypothetical protein